MPDKVTIGLFGTGLDTYWSQFEGLLDKLLGYQSEISSRLSGTGAEVVDAGMVDSPEKAIAASRLFRMHGVEMVILNISTYSLSHNVLPLLLRNTAPVLVLNLQPVKALDYDRFNAIGDRGMMTGEWLSLCQSCVTPELASVFKRAGIKYNLVTGYLGDQQAWKEIGEWIQACSVKSAISRCRIGVMGHYYNGMLDVYSDITRLASVFGCHFEIMEFGGLKKLAEDACDAEISQKLKQFGSWFEVSPECSPDDLRMAAAGSAALDRLVEKNDLDALAYYYEGEGDEVYEKLITALIPGMTLLTGSNIPAAGECEVKNAIAMKIMDLFDSGGSFSEFYLADFEADELLLGHDGPAHFRIAEGKVGLVPLPLYHGKPGKGLSIQMKVAKGPVTLLSVCESGDGAVTLLCAEGLSVEGPTMHIANTNSRYKFSIPVKDFINQWSAAGPSHHCAIGTGHISGKIEKLAKLLNAGYLKIC
jgi:L-arabinose isomerase